MYTFFWVPLPQTIIALPLFAVRRTGGSRGPKGAEQDNPLDAGYLVISATTIDKMFSRDNCFCIVTGQITGKSVIINVEA